MNHMMCLLFQYISGDASVAIDTHSFLQHDSANRVVFCLMRHAAYQNSEAAVAEMAAGAVLSENPLTTLDLS